MEALIYDDSPLADYLRGDATPFEPDATAPLTPPQYAPKGRPRVRDRLRALRDTARSVADLADERFLERFRYTIIASQLLSDESQPRARLPGDDVSRSITLTLRGVLFTTGLSFFVPWVLHWLRSHSLGSEPVGWSQICLYTTVGICAAILLTFAARRQYLRFVRHSAVAAASKLVSGSHDFDSVTSAALRYLQEIEVVARGYRMQVSSVLWKKHQLTRNRSHPLPPISRMDDKQVTWQCRELRSLVSTSLTASLTQFVHFHNELRPSVDAEDLSNYYYIYELSTEDFADGVNFANDLSVEAQETLRQLRFLFSLHVVARKLLLIDLLALRPRPSWSDVSQWRKVLRILHTLVEDHAQATERLRLALKQEEMPESEEVFPDRQVMSRPTKVSPSPSRRQSQAQIQRFEGIAGAVRSLNAKVRIARDEVSDLVANEASEATISSAIAKHYEHVGSELRNLLVDWEKGRNTMLLSVEREGRYSRPSSGGRSPISPSPSLGGVTMVEGGPADALRLLNGEDEDESGQGGQKEGPDEEVFEAVARPRKRMSLALTREEKMAKLQEGRRKRATLQEQAETTTNMLRELQMVIKHRPQQRTNTPRVTSV